MVDKDNESQRPGNQQRTQIISFVSLFCPPTRYGRYNKISPSRYSRSISAFLPSLQIQCLLSTICPIQTRPPLSLSTISKKSLEIQKHHLFLLANNLPASPPSPISPIQIHLRPRSPTLHSTLLPTCNLHLQSRYHRLRPTVNFPPNNHRISKVPSYHDGRG